MKCANRYEILQIVHFLHVGNIHKIKCKVIYQTQLENLKKIIFFLDDVASQFVQMYLFLNTSVLDKRKGIPKNLYFYTYFFEKKWQIKFQKVGNLKNGGKTQMANITKWWEFK